MKFSGGKACIMREDIIWAIGEPRGKLYSLNAPDGSLDRTHKASDDNLERWHSRFGHVDPSTIPKLSAMVIGMPTIKGDPDRERWKGCLLGQMTRMPFRDATTRKQDHRTPPKSLYGPVWPCENLVDRWEE